MFTGIIEEIGHVSDMTLSGRTAVLVVAATKVLDGVKSGDSIAVNGICLTVADFSTRGFTADLSEETLSVAGRSLFRRGRKVNLERALRLGDRLGGHIVTGHVDTIGSVSLRKDTASFSVFHIEYQEKFERYIVEKGSIAVDGTSLTVSDAGKGKIKLNIIPHTLKETTLQFLKKGEIVNLEFDIIAKYTEKMMATYARGKGLTQDLLYSAGFSSGAKI